MRLRVELLAVVLASVAVPAFAGTKIQLNIIPSPADCSLVAGPACLNSGAACGDIAGNTDCIAAGVSPKSKVSLDGKLLLKATFKGVVDNVGAPVTTGAERRG